MRATLGERKGEGDALSREQGRRKRADRTLRALSQHAYFCLPFFALVPIQSSQSVEWKDVMVFAGGGFSWPWRLREMSPTIVTLAVLRGSRAESLSVNVCGPH